MRRFILKCLNRYIFKIPVPSVKYKDDYELDAVGNTLHNYIRSKLSESKYNKEKYERK